MELRHATILITGGSSGIGFELARQLLRRDNTVIVASRSDVELASARSREPALHTFLVDVSDGQSIAALHANVTREFPDLNVLINCAGVMRKIDLQGDRAMSDLTKEVDVNLKGTMWMNAQFLPLLKRQPRAAIVNVSSGLAYSPMALAPIYSATKAAIHSYTQSLRVQLAATKVEVFELAPPGTDTPMYLGDFTNEDVGGAKPMSVEAMVKAAISAVERGTPEIAIGLAKVLRFLSRAMPGFLVRQMNHAAVRMARTHVS